MAFRHRLTAGVGLVCLLLLMTHSLSRSYPLGRSGGLSSTLYAASGIVASILLCVTVRRPGSAGTSETSWGEEAWVASALTAGRRSGPLAVGCDTVGLSRRGWFRADRARRLTEDLRGLHRLYPAAQAVVGEGGRVEILERV
jgi:hypothetical protein